MNKLIWSTWSQPECYLEVKQNEMGRWLWDVVNVKNELIRRATEWRGVPLKREKQRRWQVGCSELYVFSENRMADLGRACLVEIGCKSGWWARCRHIYNTLV